MGGCGCGTKAGKDNLEKMFAVLEEGGLREIGEQALGATDTMAQAIRYLDRADRAAGLGLGEGVATMHREAAVRWNRQSQQQFRTVIERIDDRRNQDDWKDLVERVRTEFPNRNGPQSTQDLAAEAKAVILDTDRVSGADAREIGAIIDRGAKALIEGGLPGITNELRNAMQAGLNAAQHPEMGRQPASPISAARGACIAAAWVAAAVALAICSVILFCWCCFWPIIAAALAVALTACGFID